jgi:hypothetical protein
MTEDFLSLAPAEPEEKTNEMETTIPKKGRKP